MILPLTRPLICVDLETHAYGQPDTLHIVELGFIIFYPDNRPPVTWSSLVKSPEPITAQATEKHGITNEMLACCKICGFIHSVESDHDFTAFPTFAQLAPRLASGFSDCDLCGYGVKFDARVLAAEFARAGVAWSSRDAKLLDPNRLWSLAMPRSLTDAVREFLGREPTAAHRAAGDAQDAWEVAVAMLERFTQLPRDVGALHEMSFPKDENQVDPDGKFVYNEAGDVVCNFGGVKGHKGKLLSEIPTFYLEWILRNNFSDEVKILVDGALHGVYPVKP